VLPAGTHAHVQTVQEMHAAQTCAPDRVAVVKPQGMAAHRPVCSVSAPLCCAKQAGLRKRAWCAGAWLVHKQARRGTCREVGWGGLCMSPPGAGGSEPRSYAHGRSWDEKNNGPKGQSSKEGLEGCVTHCVYSQHWALVARSTEGGPEAMLMAAAI